MVSESEGGCIGHSDIHTHQYLGMNTWTVTDGDVVHMPKGVYYVGNLNGVLNETTRDELSVLHQNGPHETPIEGKFTLSDGRDVVSFFFETDESTQIDQQHMREYKFKGSGIASLTLAAGLEEEYGDWDGGHIINFEKDFICQSSTFMTSSYRDEKCIRITFGDEVCLNAYMKGSDDVLPSSSERG